jgi:preprotein translocase subunit YajC
VHNWTFLVPLVLILALVLFSQRARRRQAAQESARAAQIRFGTDVMTTSGLYGTVVALNDDETVQLAIARGVEVRWALAALREVSSLPDRYRGAVDPGASEQPGEAVGAGADHPADDAPARSAPDPERFGKPGADDSGNGL